MRSPPATSRPPPTSRSSTPSCTSRRSTPRAASPSTSPSSRAAATCRPSATSARRPSALIPVDAIFSPVRRVAFSVEPTRVEQATNYDKLTLEIETDGSISPRDALSSAGDTLRNLVALVADLSDEPRGLELGEVAPSTRVARPRAADRGARPVGAAAQLPQAGPRRHHRPARAEDRGRPPRDHELRFEVARRGPPEARRAGPGAAGQGVDRCRPRRRVRASGATPRTSA